MKKKTVMLMCYIGIITSIISGCGNSEKEVHSENVVNDEAVEEICEEAQMCQGTWVNYVGDEPITTYIQIDGEHVYHCYSNGSSEEVAAEFGTKDQVVYLKAHQPHLDDYDWYSLLKDESGNLILNDCLNEGYLTSTAYVSGYKKVSDEIITINFDQVPSIGMNKGDLIFSSWGKPKDKNITKTASGTTEQWVYSDYRYVYLEDNIVTAIQE